VIVEINVVINVYNTERERQLQAISGGLMGAWIEFYFYDNWTSSNSKQIATESIFALNLMPLFHMNCQDRPYTRGFTLTGIIDLL